MSMSLNIIPLPLSWCPSINTAVALGVFNCRIPQRAAGNLPNLRRISDVLNALTNPAASNGDALAVNFHKSAIFYKVKENPAWAGHKEPRSLTPRLRNRGPARRVGRPSKARTKRAIYGWKLGTMLLSAGPHLRQSSFFTE